jgi:serine/threonine-protein kinase
VTRKVEVKVTDFGLSRFFAGETPALNLTQSGVTLGTPLYMSPEQVQGQPVDNRSDIYSFGVTCFHLLSGEPPFKGTTAFEVALKHVQEKPRLLSDLRPDLPADLCGVVHKMMAKNPEDRYQSAREVLRDLIKVRDGLATGTAPLLLTQMGAPVGPAASDATLRLSNSASAAPAPSVQQGGAGKWLLAFGACLLAAAGGVLAYAALNPADPSVAANPNANPPAPGLPDVRPLDKLSTTRERELIAVLNHEGTKHDDTIKAAVELGLLYVKERRLAEANDRFGKLRDRAAEWRDPVTARAASVAGRLGMAVVLAHENKADASNKLFLEVVQEQPKAVGPKLDRAALSVSWTLLRHPDLSHAVSEALNRNAANLGKTKLEPAALEQLRTPPRTGKKE